MAVEIIQIFIDAYTIWPNGCGHLTHVLIEHPFLELTPLPFCSYYNLHSSGKALHYILGHRCRNVRIYPQTVSSTGTLEQV